MLLQNKNAEIRTINLRCIFRIKNEKALSDTMQNKTLEIDG